MTRQVPIQLGLFQQSLYRHLRFTQYTHSDFHYRQHGSFIRHVYHESEVEVHVQSMRHGGLI